MCKLGEDENWAYSTGISGLVLEGKDREQASAVGPYNAF